MQRERQGGTCNGATRKPAGQTKGQKAVETVRYAEGRGAEFFAVVVDESELGPGVGGFIGETD